MIGRDQFPSGRYVRFEGFRRPDRWDDCCSAAFVEAFMLLAISFGVVTDGLGVGMPETR
jgi:hypothetical protein